MSIADTATLAGAAYDVERIRADFPILADEMNGKPLVFLDSAASAQKPRRVIDAVRYVYEHEYANVHRGLYALSEAATARYEASRDKVQKLINAEKRGEIVFTRNATEAINLVAASWGRKFLNEGDEIVISELEHHSNIVPWQMLRDEKGVVLRIVPVTDEGAFDFDVFQEMLGPKTKLVALAHVSNVLGTVLPIEKITRAAHAAGAKVLVDGCQGVVHMPVDVQAIGCDFYAFSGHKLYGPSGIGILYGREELLDAMPPYQGGGDMISSVTFEKTEWAALPHKFEAGTPAIAQAIGLGAAVDYVTEIGMDAIAAHEAELVKYGMQQLSSVPGMRLFGTVPGKASVMSFLLETKDGDQTRLIHPHDIATIVDRAGIAVRAGHHCAQPLMERMDVPAMVRASLGMYSRREDIDALVGALEQVREIFG